jgi:predicted Rossmann fold flavoprotein
MSTNNIRELIIVGGGPAGCMCAIQASKKGIKSTIIEQKDDILIRLLVSGGGKCNLSNILNKKEFWKGITINSDFLHSSFNQFNNVDVKEYFENRGLKTKLEKNKYIFPLLEDSIHVYNVFRKELEETKTEIINDKVTSVEKENEIFTIHTEKTIYYSKRLVFATGGQSYKNLGTSLIAYETAKKFNIKYDDNFTAANVPIITKNSYKEIQGLALRDVHIKYGKVLLKDDLLFTHFGLSGPGIIRISCHIDEKNLEKIYIRASELKNEELENKIKENIRINPKKNLLNNLDFLDIPKNYLQFLLKEKSEKKSAEVSNKNIQEIVNLINNYEIEIKTKAKIDIGFSTNGGIDVNELKQKNLESKKVKNLYFIGEVNNITCYTGGYNISTWISQGYCCGANME